MTKKLITADDVTITYICKYLPPAPITEEEYLSASSIDEVK